MAQSTPPIAAPETGRSPCVHLGDDDSRDRDVVGGKAAALATAADHGIPILPGVVLTTDWCRDVDRGAPVPEHPAVLEASRAIGHKSPERTHRSDPRPCVGTDPHRSV